MNAGVRSTGGDLALKAADALVLSAGVTVATSATVSLDAQSGALAMAATAGVSGSSVRLHAAADVVLGHVAGTGVSVVAGGSVLGAAGSGANVSGGSLRLQAAGTLGTAQQALATAVDTLSGRAGSGAWITEADAVTVGTVALSVSELRADGTVALVSDAAQSELVTGAGGVLVLRSGSTAVATPVDGQGRDVDLVADTLVLDAPVTSPGANATIRPADATRVLGVGDAMLDDGQSLYVGHAALSQLGEGFAQVVIGSGAAQNQTVRIAGVQQAVAWKDPVLIDAHGAGSRVELQGTVQAEAFTVHGAGSATHAGALALQVQREVVIDDALQVQGTVLIQAGLSTDVADDGDITLARSVDGQAGGEADVLTLDAQGGHVRVLGSVGASQALDGLRVVQAHDVSFEQSVAVTGDVEIHASGTVTFQGALTLSHGTLRIVGATRVVLGDVVLGEGDVVISADALVLHGTVQGSAGAGVSLSPSRTGAGLVIGQGDASQALVLSAQALSQLHGFGRVELHAGGDIAVRESVALSDAGADLVLSSGAALTMAATALLSTAGGEITLQAHGDLGVGLVHTHGGGAVLVSTAGTITDAALDEAVNVRAGWVALRGHGPVLGAGAASTAAAVDVEAARVDVDAASGHVLRDGDAQGRTLFNLLDAGVLYQQLMVYGEPQRMASGPQPAQPGVADGGVAAQRFAAWIAALQPTVRSLEAAQSLQSLQPLATASLAVGAQAAGYLERLGSGDAEAQAAQEVTHKQALGLQSVRLLSEESFGLAARLEPTVPGNGRATVYWSDELML